MTLVGSGNYYTFNNVKPFTSRNFDGEFRKFASQSRAKLEKLLGMGNFNLSTNITST